ncbi:hypothetical protein PanWU01x14_031370 [Parasponia andersonii]|uniref:Neprosin PEP catalytic domain-containing protein n=1 Tax=Parasponia andersonii TaxID=3476 RepID=A0A2P5DU81_PARAD|nr:hypothetical protein PanWU01x14_031370 [Parasponia andersonii]
MAMSWVVLLLSIVCFCLPYNGGAEGGPSRLTKKEELEIEKQLKLLNKPAVKSIKMKPTSPPKRMNDKESSMVVRPLVEMALKGESCPIGTVPIKKITKEDLIREKMLNAGNPGLHRAIVRTKEDPNRKYNGGGTGISVYMPATNASQYSSGQMTIQNGPDTIQVGWTAGGVSCFNTRCPGFVIVNTEVPLDSIIKPSQQGGPVNAFNYYVYRDKVTGDWWLELGLNYTQIGYWPQRIFSGLKDLATYLDWGGEANVLAGQAGPHMGVGQFPIENIYYDAFCMRITTINEAHETVDAKDTEEFTTNADFYRVKDYKNGGQELRHVVLFGGPGPR